MTAVKTRQQTKTPSSTSPGAGAAGRPAAATCSVLGELAVRYDIETKPAAFRGRVPRRLTARRTCAGCCSRRWPDSPRSSSGRCCWTRKNRVVGQRVIYQGNVSAVSSIRTAEVLRPAVVEAVPGVIVAHNHPSGDPEPSPEDIAVTKALVSGREGSWTSQVLDHVVIGCPGIVSLKERGVILG